MDIFVQDKTNEVFQSGDRHRWNLENKRRSVHYLYKHNLKESELYFSLCSYALIPFDNVALNIEFEIVTKLSKRIKVVCDQNFNRLIFKNKRSTKAKHFLETLSKFNTNSYTWFSINHDHPFLKHPGVIENLLNECYQDKALNTGYIIPFSHWQELVNQIGFFSKNYMNTSGVVYKLIEERNNYYILECNKQVLDSNFIAPNWFLKEIFERIGPETPMRRIEDTSQYLKPNPLIVVVPKIELCRHIDGYNIKGSKDIPPLYIPDNFFTNNMRVQISGDSRSANADVWVTDKCQKFAFEDKDGADFPGQFSDIPYFWKDYVDLSNEQFDELYFKQDNKRESLYNNRSTDPFYLKSKILIIFRNIFLYLKFKIKQFIK